MPWKETSHMEERARFVILANERKTPLSSLCQLFGISRETGYKWLNRYELQGLAGLCDLSRKPKSNNRATRIDVVDAVVQLRREFPLWGAKKLAVLLKERRPELKLPAISTLSEILERRGLVKKRKPRRKSLPQIKPDLTIQDCNDVWCTDFKGHFLVGNGKRCHPLTLTDAFSRYLLCCESLTNESISSVKPLYQEVFLRFGLPKIILSDNGSPFASRRAPGGLTQLSAWWVKLGITPVQIEPGHPEQNGRHERMHRTLKSATAFPSAESLKKQQTRFTGFMNEYNNVRPHEALALKRPGEIYRSSMRTYNGQTNAPSYPGNFEVRNVRSNGEIKWKGKNIFLSEVFIGESIGMEEIGHQTMLIHFFHLPIALLDEHKRKITVLPSQLKLNRLSAMSSD